MRAYVLVQTEVGKATLVEQHLSADTLIPHIARVSLVTGPYDLVVEVNGMNINELARVVVDKIQSISHVVRTLTCPVISLS